LLEAKIDDVPKIEQRLAKYFLVYFKKHASNASLQEKPIIQLVWQILEKNNLKTELIEMAIAVFPFLESQGQFQRGLDLLEQGLLLAKGEENKHLICMLQRAMGSALTRLGDYFNADKYLTNAYSLAESLNDQELLLDSLQNLGLLRYHQGEFEEAQTYYKKAEENAKDLNNLRRIVIWHVNLSSIDGQRGHYEDVVERLKPALSIARKMGWNEAIVVILQNCSVANTFMGKFDLAEADVLQAIQLAEESELNSRLPDLLLIAGGPR
jgi:tetratricopeptide (TPR) repeat protein